MSPAPRFQRRTIPSFVGLLAIVGLAVPSAGVQASTARVAGHQEASAALLPDPAVPSFTYDRHDGNAFGEGWPEGAIVTLSVDGGVAIETFPNPDLAQHWVAWDIGAQPGQTITATDGTTSKDLSVTSVEVTEIDEPNDTIRGLGPPGATVLVGHDGELPVTVLGDGTWTADLATAGIELRPGDDGYAAIDDNDGDSTRWWWHVPNPTFFVEPVQDMIQFMVDWTPGGLIDVTIDGADAPGSPFTFQGDGGNVEFAQDGIDLHVGTVVVAIDRTTGIVRQHTVRNLTVDRLTNPRGGGALDPNGGIISGTADPTTDVVVGIYWPESVRANQTVTTGTGTDWSADTNSEAFNYVGLQPGFGGYVVIWDDDGDGTQINWRVLDPRITVDPLSEQLWAGEFASNAPVTLTVDGTAAPGGPYSTDDWGGLSVAFDPNQLDLETGDVVEFSDGLATKQLVLAALTVDADEEHLTMSGTTDAPDDTYVNVYLGSTWRDALVTSGGWAADFGLEPGPGTGDGTLTVFGGNSQGAAQIWDDDGDSTQVNFQSPYIHVSPFNGYVFGDNWAPGEPVTVVVDSVPVEPAPTADESGHLEFELATTPGNTVVATQSGWIAHVVVQVLEITAVNEPTDGIVSGIAPEGALVDVVAWTDNGQARRIATTTDGTFTVDFSLEGTPEDWEPSIVELTPGTQLRAHLYNDRDAQDHDATHHDYFLPAVYGASMHVTFSHGGSNVLALGWPEGEQLHLTVERYDEFDGLQIVFEKDVVVDQPDDQGNISQAWFDPEVSIERHDIVTITGGGYTTTHQVTDITFDIVDADNDIVSGRGAWHGPVCVDIWMWPDDPATACTSPDEFGNWAISFSGIYDLDSNTVMGVFDRDEGGATQVDWSVPLEPQISVWMGQRPDDRGQMVTGENWPEGQPVTMEIDDPDTTGSSDPDYENEATPNGNGVVDFYPNEGGFVIEPGFTVTMSDGTTTRTHVVTSVVATATDPEADLVHGVAEPGSMVTVGIWGPFPYRQVYAGADEDDGLLDQLGPWTADFSIPQGDQPAIDLVEDPGCPIPAPAPCAPFVGEAWQADDDGDMTRSQWWVPGDGGGGAFNWFNEGDVIISSTDGRLLVYHQDGNISEYGLPFGNNFDIQYLDPGTLLIAAQDQGVMALDLASGNVFGVVGDPELQAIALAIDHENERMFVSDEDSGVWLYEWSNGDWGNGTLSLLVDEVPDGEGGTVSASADALAYDRDWDDEPNSLIVHGLVYFANAGTPIYRFDPDTPDPEATVEVFVDNPDGRAFNGMVFNNYLDLTVAAGNAVMVFNGYGDLVADIPVAGAHSIEDVVVIPSTDGTPRSDMYLIDSGFVTGFGDDPALYFLLDELPDGTAAIGSLQQPIVTEVHRGEPLGDTVDLLIAQQPPRYYPPELVFMTFVDETGPIAHWIGTYISEPGWPSNHPITVTVDDGDGYHEEYETMTNDWGWFSLDLAQPEYGGLAPGSITAGWTLTASTEVDGQPIVKTLITRQLTMDVIDRQAGHAEGACEANSQDLQIGVFDWPFAFPAVSCSDVGTWSTDWTPDGVTGPSVAYEDDAVNRQMIEIYIPPPVPEPIVQAYVTEEFFRGEGFTPNSSATVSLYDTDGTTLLIDHQGIGTDGDGTFWYGDPGIEQGLMPDMVLEVTDDATGITKTLQLVDVRFDSFDPADHVVAGFAPDRPLAGEIRLHLTDQDGSPLDDGTGHPMALYPTTADWSFDLDDHAALHPDYPDSFPDGLLEARVEVPDEDGDGTFGQLPQVRASAQFGYVNSDHFDSDPFVRVDVYRDEGEGSMPVWNSGTVETSPRGEFHVDSEVGLQPDDVVVVTGLTTLVQKHLVLGDITIDEFDVDIDRISGTAPPFSTIEVGVGNEWCGSGMRVVADADGHWLANFSTQPGCDAEWFDITDDMGAQAMLLDPDMDATVAEPPPPPEPPRIVADPFRERVYAERFPTGGQLTLTVHDDMGVELVSPIAASVDGPTVVFDLFALEPDLFDLRAGQIVSISYHDDDPATTDTDFDRALVIAEIGVQFVDDNADVIHGTIDPGAGMWVGAWNDDGGGGQWIQTDPNGDGSWQADLRHPDEGTPIDIDKSQPWGLYLHVPDDDGDATVYAPPGATPGLVAYPELDLVTTEGSGFGVNTIEIPEQGYSSTGDLDHERYGSIAGIEFDSLALTDELHTYARTLDLAGEIDLQPGMVIISHDVLWEMSVTIQEFTVDRADTASDTLGGSIEHPGFVGAFVAGPAGFGFVESPDNDWEVGLTSIVDHQPDGSYDLTSADVGIAFGADLHHLVQPFDTYTGVVWDLRPHITSLVVGDDPTAVGDPVHVSATFRDIEFPDSHSVSVNWGDGTTTTITAAPKTVETSHIYAEPGIYTITLTAFDAAGQSDTVSRGFVVVYDPDGGFVTGGGWIDSPTGAYTADPDLSGRAQFGFVSRYKKGASAPDGNSNFQFQTADLHFQSTSYDWLVITGSDHAKFKGAGTINGAGEYGFMITAVDDPDGDTFRIKIWDVDTGATVYDNKAGAVDASSDGTALGGGSIVVHDSR